MIPAVLIFKTINNNFMCFQLLLIYKAVNKKK